MNEFSLIKQFFQPFPLHHSSTVFGIGDDAACVEIPSGKQLVVSTDTLVSGVHFLPEWKPYDIAYRSVAVAVSDIAAMGAEASSLTLALTLPDLCPQWLTLFTQGLKDALHVYQIDLIGGDTTRGPLSITLTVMGMVAAGQAVRRNGAQAEDVIFISGQLGGAALAIDDLKKNQLQEPDRVAVMEHLLRPKARLDLAHLLGKYASSAIDISDGLSADLNHICTASKVGATLIQQSIPIHPLVHQYLADKAIDLALCGGDDYELCFTVPAKQLSLFQDELNKAHLLCYPIGIIDETMGLRMKTEKDEYKILTPKGYSHFS